jgi:hypothetical protein
MCSVLGNFARENGDVQGRHESDPRGNGSFSFRFSLVSIMGIKGLG